MGVGKGACHVTDGPSTIGPPRPSVVAMDGLPGPCTAATLGPGEPSTSLSITTVGPPLATDGPPPLHHSLAWLLQKLNIHDIACVCPHHVKLGNTLPDWSSYQYS